jgi:hypothetical protein
MMNSRTKTTLLTLALTVVLVGAACAEVLHSQIDYDPMAAGFYNSISGAPPFGMTWYGVNDITVGGTGWEISAISTFYSKLDEFWGAGITTGVLHVWPKTGPLPTEDPTLSTTVAMTGTDIGGAWEVRAAGLSLELEPGEYWIGITPVAPAGMMGPEIHLSTMTLVGDAAASWDAYAFPGPPSWFNFQPGRDATLLIEGDSHVVSVEESSWGGLKAIYR